MTLTRSPLATVDVAIFASTVLIILLHGVEWFNVFSLSPPSPAGYAHRKASVLKAGLGVEMVYYFLLLVALVVFYSRNVVLLGLVAVLGLVHLGAFQGTVGAAEEKILRNLTKRRIIGVLAFDAIEVVILMAIAFQFYPTSVCYFVCFS